MNKNIVPALCLLLTTLISVPAVVPVYAKDAQASPAINENELFGATDTTMVDAKEVVNNASIIEENTEKKKTSISGELTTVADFTASRDYIEDGNDTQNRYFTYIAGNLMLDARLKQGVKGFANLETQYYSQTGTTLVNIRELFLDFNAYHRVYFRAGKQVLQWGRCYLWNPTDLINVEKKPFIQKVGYREGAYGLKYHVPFGTTANIYGFLDSGNAADINSTAVAVKVDVLVGKTEMALAGWTKKGFIPVYGYDFSTRVFGLDILGEAAFSYGDNRERMIIENGMLSKAKKKDEWVTKASVGFGRAFDCLNVPDRINVITEFYYDQNGYNDNVLSDPKSYSLANIPGNLSLYWPVDTKKNYIKANDLYESNYFSQRYAALFVSVSKFIISDMSLSTNIISNLIDGSGMVSTGLSYRNMNDFIWGLTLIGYYGGADAEYTFNNSAIGVRMNFGITF
ncbi:MAG: hypothetical protein WC955_00595 [Elusimicrobiota bacterium]